MCVSVCRRTIPRFGCEASHLGLLGLELDARLPLCLLTGICILHADRLESTDFSLHSHNNSVGFCKVAQDNYVKRMQPYFYKTRSFVEEV